MTQFMAVYMGTPPASQQNSAWNKLSDDERKKRIGEGMDAWMAWGRKHEKAIVVNGGPLGKTKRTGPEGVSDIKNLMTGFTIIEAESHEAAAKMFEGHPHFTIFPGDAVEIMEVLPIPTAP